MILFVALAWADPLEVWSVAAETRSAVGLQARVPARLRVEAAFLAAVEAAHLQGDARPMARLAATLPPDSPFRNSAERWVALALSQEAYDRDVSASIVFDELWAETPWSPSVHLARLVVLQTMVRLQHPDPGLAVRATLDAAAERADELPFLVRGALSGPERAAAARWAVGELGDNGRWWEVPHPATAEAEGIALWAELQPWSTKADPEDWIRLGTPAPAREHEVTAPRPPSAWPATGGWNDALAWESAPPAWFPPLGAPDSAIEALWRYGRFDAALRRARQLHRAPSGDRSTNWLWWMEAWTARRARPEEGLEWLRRIADAEDDPSYRVAAARLLVAQLGRHDEDLWTRLDEARDPLREELARLVAIARIWEPQECLAIADWRLQRGDAVGGERWGHRAIYSAPNPDRAAIRATLAARGVAVAFDEADRADGLFDFEFVHGPPLGPTPWATEDLRMCCSVGVPTPIVVAVGGSRAEPSVVPFVPRVQMDSCGDLARWLHDHRTELGMCLSRPDSVEAVVRVDPEGRVTGEGLDPSVRGCLAELQSGGPELTWDLVVRDLRFRETGDKEGR